jgi:hypothetical protein
MSGILILVASDWLAGVSMIVSGISVPEEKGRVWELHHKLQESFTVGGLKVYDSPYPPGGAEKCRV